MKRLIILTVALCATSAQAEWCMPSVLALSTSPAGNMHPGKSPDRPGLLAVSPSEGVGAIWWCKDGTVWEYHGTPAMLVATFGDMRAMQGQYVVYTDKTRAMARSKPSCFAQVESEKFKGYPVPLRQNRLIWSNNRITDKAEQALCAKLVAQAAEDWPK